MMERVWRPIGPTQIVIAVVNHFNYTEALLLAFPKEIEGWFEGGSIAEDSGIANTPKEPGVYLCEVQAEDKGFEEWGWHVAKAERVWEYPVLSPGYELVTGESDL